MSRRLIVLVAVLALGAAACGGGSDDNDIPEVTDTQGPSSSDPDEPSDSGSSDGGTLENPTPEAGDPLSANSIRIGTNAWERTVPTDGQCFVEEGRGTAWGSVSNEEGVEFRVDQDEDGAVEAQVSSNLMSWISGVKDGTELEIDLDAGTSTLSGTGLFYNGHTDEWAYGSFSFTCQASEG